MSLSDFGVLGASTVTNTGPTFIQGQVGVSPGSAITGFPPGKHAAGGDPMSAQSELANLIATSALLSSKDLTGRDLGSQVLPPGAYKFSSSAQLTGILTLDARGDPNAKFIFIIGSTLTTASNSSVRLINDAQAKNVSWAIGSSATLGTHTRFAGLIMAAISITLNTGVYIDGAAWAHKGAVTLDSNTINLP